MAGRSPSVVGRSSTTATIRHNIARIRTTIATPNTSRTATVTVTHFGGI
jgi:hypothetical protein